MQNGGCNQGAVCRVSVVPVPFEIRYSGGGIHRQKFDAADLCRSVGELPDWRGRSILPSPTLMPISQVEMELMPMWSACSITRAAAADNRSRSRVQNNRVAVSAMITTPAAIHRPLAY